ncbi:MAG: hypothetical protein ACI9MR_005073 [Myxococcota bacterium]|jgi:hypothetical protein
MVRLHLGHERVFVGGVVVVFLAGITALATWIGRSNEDLNLTQAKRYAEAYAESVRAMRPVYAAEVVGRSTGGPGWGWPSPKA